MFVPKRWSRCTLGLTRDFGRSHRARSKSSGFDGTFTRLTFSSLEIQSRTKGSSFFFGHSHESLQHFPPWISCLSEGSRLGILPFDWPYKRQELAKEEKSWSIFLRKTLCVYIIL